MVRECGLLCSCGRGGWRPGRAFIPTAQSGLAGKGCLDEVDVNVRREDDDVVEDEAVEDASSPGVLFPLLPLPLDVLLLLSLGPTVSFRFMLLNECGVVATPGP